MTPGATADAANFLPVFAALSCATSARVIVTRAITYGDRAPEGIPHDPDNGWEYTDDSMMGVQLHGTVCDTAGSGSQVQIPFYCTGG